MLHPLFGSRCWTIDPNVTTTSGRHLRRTIPDRPTLMDDLLEMSEWYVNAGRAHSLERLDVLTATEVLEGGRTVPDDLIGRLEEMAAAGPPASLSPDDVATISELDRLSMHEDVSLGVVSEARDLMRQLASSGLQKPRREAALNLRERVSATLQRARGMASLGPWFPGEDDEEMLKTFSKLIASKGPWHSSGVIDYSRTKQCLRNWIAAREENRVQRFPRRYFELLQSMYGAEMEELCNPAFKPGDAVKRRKRSWWLSKNANQNAVLIVVSGPDVLEPPNGSGVGYLCFEPGIGEVFLRFDEIKIAKKPGKNPCEQTASPVHNVLRSARQ